jgi:hypothetical protein
MLLSEIDERTPVGSNRHGDRFEVGLLRDRWIGYAIATGGDGAETVHTLDEIAEDGSLQMGVRSFELAVRLTSAIAQDPCQGWGGIDTWNVESRLRGTPDEFRCPSCSNVGCRGGCAREQCDEALEA